MVSSFRVCWFVQEGGCKLELFIVVTGIAAIACYSSATVGRNWFCNAYSFLGNLSATKRRESRASPRYRDRTPVVQKVSFSQNPLDDRHFRDRDRRRYRGLERLQIDAQFPSRVTSNFLLASIAIAAPQSSVIFSRCAAVDLAIKQKTAVAFESEGQLGA